MTIGYWDYWSSATSTGSTTGTDAWGQGARYYFSNSGGMWRSGTQTATTTSDFWCRPVIRKYLVRVPDHWGDAALADFVHLINDETNTGFTVEMVIQGDIRITDPTIDIRTMEEMGPLFKRYASGADRDLIAAFFNKHGTTTPKKKKAAKRKAKDKTA